MKTLEEMSSLDFLDACIEVGKIIGRDISNAEIDMIKHNRALAFVQSIRWNNPHSHYRVTMDIGSAAQIWKVLYQLYVKDSTERSS